MKTYIKIILYFLAVLLVMSTACTKKDIHREIKIRNNSDKGIYFQDRVIYENSEPRFISDYNPALSKLNFYCAAKESNIIWTRSTFEGDFNRGAKYLQIIIFDEDVIYTVPFDTVRKYDMTLKRYNLTLENLQDLNWTVYYPPTESMRYINQSPPFE